MWGAVTGNYGWILDDEDVATRELERYRAPGGGTICDPTNVGIGRQPAGLRRVSERSGVHIVMGAGWYRERCYAPYINEEMPDQLAERLVVELTEGVDGTDIRAGFIGEIGTERGFITPAQERVFRAAGRAHVRTGCPDPDPHDALRRACRGATRPTPGGRGRLARVIVSHLGDRVGIHWWMPIARRGAYLDVDNLAFSDGYAPLSVRADNVAAFVAEGLVDQVMLSNDICVLDQLASYGGPGYDNVITNFVPLLRERGVTEEQIRTMMVTNPAAPSRMTPKAPARGSWPSVCWLRHHVEVLGRPSVVNTRDPPQRLRRRHVLRPAFMTSGARSRLNATDALRDIDEGRIREPDVATLPGDRAPARRKDVLDPLGARTEWHRDVQVRVGTSDGDRQAVGATARPSDVMDDCPDREEPAPCEWSSKWRSDLGHPTQQLLQPRIEGAVRSPGALADPCSILTSVRCVMYALTTTWSPCRKRIPADRSRHDHGKPGDRPLRPDGGEQPKRSRRPARGRRSCGTGSTA